MCREVSWVEHWSLFPGNSPSSTPVSVKSPVTGTEEDEADPPQLSVKREFSIKRGRETENGWVILPWQLIGQSWSRHGPGFHRHDTDQSRFRDRETEVEEEDSQQSNLLDCLVQAQNFALQQAAGNKNFDNNISNFSPQHIMQGGLLKNDLTGKISMTCHGKEETSIN